MRYKIEIKKSALKFISRQTKEQQERLLKAINALPSQGDIKQLKGRSGIYRLRVGLYRILFEENNDKLLIIVIDVDTRGDIYKR